MFKRQNPIDVQDEEKRSELQEQINKRLSLNLLIQGAAAHTFLTAHHLVREELESVKPGLTAHYDKFAISLHLSYFIGDAILVYGPPWLFWLRRRWPGHPFRKHAFLAKHGWRLTRASKRHLVNRGKEKGAWSLPVVHYVQLMRLVYRTEKYEEDVCEELEPLARKVVSRIWGIADDQLDAEITKSVVFGKLRTPKTWVGKMTRYAAIGYGGVVRDDDRFTVMAKAWNWTLVVHELTKGTAELVCLHGLNRLDDHTYELVTDEADQLEYETWTLQAGAEAWRLFLAAIPPTKQLADVFMLVAMLEPRKLEELMFALVESPGRAKRILAELA